MKTLKFLAIAVIGVSIVSCKNEYKSVSSLGTEIDSASYALGVNMGSQLKANFDDVEKDVFVQGFLNGLDSVDLLISQKDIRTTLNTFFKKKQQEKMKEQQAKYAKKAEETFAEYKKENEEFLATNKTKKGVKTTNSGLQYIVLKEGKGEAPKATDRVIVHYHGTNINGEVFDSSVEKNKPFETAVTAVIKGWVEGLQLMKPGAKYKFFIPQDLAYGAQQKGSKIKPFSTLIFEVELLEIKK